MKMCIVFDEFFLWHRVSFEQIGRNFRAAWRLVTYNTT